MLRKTALSLLFAGALVMLGCTDTTDSKSTSNKKDKKESAKTESGHEWWCDEHGVKESECSMCDSKVAKEFQDKGDWCKLHGRAKSQCFICDPSLQAKFAAEYIAKYGKQPPEPDGQKPEK